MVSVEGPIAPESRYRKNAGRPSRAKDRATMVPTREELTFLHKLMLTVERDASTRHLMFGGKTIKIKVANALLALGDPKCATQEISETTSTP